MAIMVKSAICLFGPVAELNVLGGNVRFSSFSENLCEDLVVLHSITSHDPLTVDIEIFLSLSLLSQTGCPHTIKIARIANIT